MTSETSTATPLPDDEPPHDWAEGLEPEPRHWLHDEARARMADDEPEPAASTLRPDGVIYGPDLLAMEFPPREPLLGRWLYPEDRMLLHGPRGSGKTHFAMAMALALSAGPEGPGFLDWHPSRAARVTYLDFELGPRKLQKALVDCHRATNPPVPVTPRLNLRPMHPRIRDAEGLRRVDALLSRHEAEVVVVDSHAFAFGLESENDAAEWSIYSDWINSLAARGVTYIGLGHDGHAKGRARGSSAREDALDLVLGLEPKGKTPAGIDVALRWSKTRNLEPGDVQALRVKLDLHIGPEGARSIWSSEAEDDEQDRRDALIVQLSRSGKQQLEIADLVGCNQSTVSRALRRARG